ncbi:aminoacyl-tRNA deacylase [Patescibacteria group bacterium]
MAFPKKLEKFLEKYGVNYEVLEHKTVYTAFDAAQTLKKKLSEIAKTLAMKVDKKYALIVLPASHRADLAKLKKLLKVKKLEIIKETEMAKALKVKPGAITPFGKFHNIPVYLDKTLLKNKLIIASTGSFSESVLMKTKDLLETGAESIGQFAKAHKYKAVKSKKSKVKIKSKPKAKIAKKKKIVKNK